MTFLGDFLMCSIGLLKSRASIRIQDESPGRFGEGGINV
jgi:hypothetical protein